MRVLQHKVVRLTIGLSVLAEAACFGGIVATNDDSMIFRLLIGFHRPALAAVGFLIPELYADDPNISAIEMVIVWASVLGAALLQWCIIFLAGIFLSRRFSRGIRIGANAVGHGESRLF